MSLPIAAQDLFKTVPFEYEGNPYLSPGNAAMLLAVVSSVEPKVVVEIGCQLGRTSRTLLRNVLSIERYIGIDVPSEYHPTLPSQRSEVPRTAGLYAMGDPRFEVILRARGSLDLVPDDLPQCDAVFIDGDHSEMAVLHDSELARAIVRPGGVIVWHDYQSVHLDCITNVLDRLHGEGWPLTAIAGTWLAYMWNVNPETKQ